MKVFIEQPGEKNQKNVFDEKTGKFLKTVPIKLTYPYPYGYILHTQAEDGENLDCYVITDKKLETESVVECEPIGMAEWFEDGEEDHKILTVLKGENGNITEEMKNKITSFAEHFFDDQPEKKCRMGNFYGEDKALKLIKKSSVPRSNYKERKYEIIPYDPMWLEKFAEQKKVLGDIFGDDAISIEHIGSTSVPGLAGKPTIDILVIVKHIGIADELTGKIESAGYTSLGEYVTSGAYLFVQEVNNTRLVNVHVFEDQHPHVQEMLNLRDYFQTHPDAVQEYSELKFELMKKHPHDYGLYRKYKDAWMNKLKQTVKSY